MVGVSACVRGSKGAPGKQAGSAGETKDGRVDSCADEAGIREDSNGRSHDKSPAKKLREKVGEFRTAVANRS